MRTPKTLTASHLARGSVLAEVAVILTLAILSPATYAATVTWSGGGGNGSWTTGANWAGTAPVSGDTLTFSGTSQTITINDLTAGTTYGGINFTNDGSAGKTGNFTLSGNSINPGTGAQDIVTTATTSGTLTDTISLTMNLTANKIIKVGAGHNLIISGNILNASGSRSLTKSGTASTGGGMLTLSGNNTYTGGTTITTGTINIGHANALGTTGNITFSGGALQYGSGITVDLSSRIKNSASAMLIDTNGQSVSFDSVLDASNSAGLTKTGSGTLTLNASNTYTGTSTISAGTLQIGNANALGTSGNITFGGGALQYGSGITVDLSNRIKNSGSAILIDTNGQSVTFASILDSSNSGGLTKTGSGTLTLNASNTYTGATTINAGTLSIATITNGGVAGALGNSTSVAGNLVLGGGTLQYTGSTGSTDRNFTLSNGTTSVIDVSSAGTTLTISGTAATTTGGLTKNGSGTLLLAGSNNYTGDTTINSGILQIGANNRISDSSTLRVNGGTFNIVTFNDTVAGVALSANGTISGTNGVLTSNSDFILENGTAAAILAGTVGVNKTTSGTVTLSAANTYTGATIINAGILQVGSGSTTGSLSTSSAITNNGTLVFNRSNTITQGTNFGSVISGTGNVTQAGTGTLTFNGTNSYIGTTTISAGTLALNSSASNNSTISGDIVINGGTLNYGTTVNDQISNSATVTMTSGSFALAARDETIGAISMSGGDLSITSGVLTLSSNSSITGGNISITSAGGGINTNSTGSATLGNAAFSYNNASNASAGLVLSSGLNVNANTTANFTNALAGVGRISLGGTTKVFDVGASANLNIGWAVVSSNSSGGLTKNGTGTMTLSAANTYTGATTINGGTLTLSGGSAIADTGAVTVASGAVLNLGASETVGAISGAGNIAMGSYTLTTNASTATSFTGILSGSGGSLTKVGSGSLTLSGANTYTGSTTISAGTLVLNGTNSNSAITVNSGGTLAGSGTGGATTINSGGKIGPGNSPGILTVGNLTLNGGATYSWEMADATGAAGAGWDQINATGLLTIGSNATSTFTIAITSSGNPSNWIYTTSNQSWDIIDYGTINGFNSSYFTLNTSAFAGDMDANSSSWSLSDTGSTLRLTYTYTATTPTYVGGTGNWSTGFSPAITTGGNATFAGLGGTATNDIASATLSSIGGLTFDGINSYTLGANSGSAGYNSASALAIGGGVTNNSTVTQTINIATSFAANQTIAGNTGSLVFGGNVAVAANATLTVVGNSSTTISGVVSGAGALTKNSNSTLTLSGNNTYSGGTTITTGTVLVGHDKAFGTGILRLGGTIASTDGTDRTISNNVGGLSGTWTYTFGQANGGTGNLTFTDTGTATFASTGSKTFNVLNTTSFASSLISSGNVTVTKIGSGTLILTGNSTYSGSTTINAGTLQIGNGGTSGALSASSTITNNGTLAFKRSNTITQGTDFANSISGTGNLTQAGSGTLVLGGTNTYTGATTISAGNLSISSVSALTNTSGVNLTNATALIYTGGAANLDRLISVTAGTGTIRNSGSGLLTLSGGLSKNGTTLTLAGGSNGITVSNAISGSSANSDLVIDGGTVNLTGTNTYNGPTSLVNGATLSANVTNALPTANGRSAVSIDATGTGSSTLALGASQSIASLTGNTTSTVTLGSNTLTLGTTSGNTTYAGRITGSSSSALVKDGASTQVLTGNNTGFTGATTISSGTLTAAAAGAMGNSTVINVTGGSFLVTAENAVNGNTAINLGGGRMAVSGSFNETVGALTLSANSTIDFSGFVGTLRFSGVGSWTAGANLAIWNWSGTTYWGTPVNNYATPSNLVFSNNSTLTSHLANISFYSDSGNSFVGSGFEVSGFSGGGSQIIAVPETETYFSAVALLAAVVIQYLCRRARQKLLKGQTAP